jgi:hypothetical protein
VKFYGSLESNEFALIKGLLKVDGSDAAMALRRKLDRFLDVTELTEKMRAVLDEGQSR